MSEYRDYDRCTRYSQDRNHPPCPHPYPQPQFRNVIPVMGPQGPAGAPGTPGAPGPGAIIPFASGLLPVLITSVANTISDAAVLGFGTSVSALALGAAPNYQFALGTASNEAFVVPRPGTITTMAATFQATILAVGIVGPINVNARVFINPVANNDNNFIATPASITLPTVTGILTPVKGTGTFSIPVVAGDRLAMVFYITGPTTGGLVTGFASAGLTIN